MRYELLANSDMGILVDRTPILRDIKDTFYVTFVLPKEGSYIALFADENGIEYRKTISDGVCKIPKELLKKEQYVGLVVSEIDGEKVVRSWQCESLRVSSFFNMRQSQWQLSGGMTDKSAYARLVELERSFADLEAAVNQYKGETNLLVTVLQTELKRLSGVVEQLQVSNETLADAYNAAIITVNKNSDRLTALEKNYDPTLIE